ncbi:unnamed protein product [Zymoseptoria tritici ST99CH_1E4]|uniref:Osmotin, thaumatin-like protein n=1 Tax=Zymoseptoria tritici ST99CH_1E4 TaxID=1276532 RepID=A0A2H1GQC5_ZYMTR|nr:unnamed protein product [Zymoseptoria tritici ST99CH_1E4]
MQLTTILLATFAALTTALPTSSLPTTQNLTARADDTFEILIINRCKWTKSFALYNIEQPSFTMVERSKPVNIPTNGQHTLRAPFHGLGYRLSGHAEWGTARQWEHQALFEFGFSSYVGVDGTAYNLSVMEGSDKDIGVRVWPIGNGKGSGQCPRKTCWPDNCPPSQGWTSPDQDKLGSPADTVCYKGKTGFRVVFCPIP